MLKNKTRTLAVIPAAGAGARMGADRAKQFLELNGKPILALTLERLQECNSIDAIIPVVPLEDIQFCKREIIKKFMISKVEKVVSGGPRRQDSVRLGIEAAGDQHDFIIIHDGVRPFIEPAMIERLIAAGQDNRAVITALPAKETVKEIDGNDFVTKSLDRKMIRLVQTPQLFRYNDIMSAHKQACLKGWEDVTDDAALIERMGIPVKVLEGSEFNIKVTTPRDLELARLIVSVMQGSRHGM